MSTMHDEPKTLLCIAEEKAAGAERIAKERKEKCRAFFKKYKFVFLAIALLIFGVIVCEIAKADDEFSVAGIDMVRIPDSAEHKGLYFGKYEVTQAQWQAIMGDNPSFFTGDSSRPVEQVSWNECQEFIKKLNARAEVKQAGLTFFLPTSEQWEYACRAGSTGKYDLLADGREGSLDEMGWYEENSGRKTHPVGQKKPNAWGLYDMHGNVWEWTASKDDSNDDRFCCGGSWYNGAENCEADNGIICNPEFRFDFLGFRLAAINKVEAERISASKEAESIVREKAEAEGKISVAGIDMVRIPDSAEHKGLYFGKYEVTQAQWEAIMGNNPSYITGDSSLPVEQVSWNECQEFIEKLNACAEVKQAGITFRLPTEEEWEYACCAGSTGDYGLLAGGREGSLDEMGWYSGNSGEETHPVGQKKPNAWGLYDMHGNVWEWTASANGSDRVSRGGSYYNNASFCVSGYRDCYSPVFRSYFLGFRLAALNKVEAERIAREETECIAREKAVAESIIKDMVQIPDSTTHKGLYFGKYEVTQTQWQAIMGNNPSHHKGDLSRPVERVFWNDCQEFINKLNARAEVKQAGLIFFLPTSEEWEYACRAGGTGKYGLLADGRDGSLDEMGWYKYNSGDETHSVGQKKPNAWGLYDMHGNVWEWTVSEDYINGRICRGGGWFNSAEVCMADSWISGYPGDRDYAFGFRLAASRTGK